MATEEETKIAEKKALHQELESVSGMLDGKCVGVEHRSVHREMTVTELLDARERFAELHGKISDLEREKALAKQHYDGLIKPLATEADCLLTDIRTKMFDIDEDCYVIHDYAANKVRYYSKTTMSLVSAREMNGSDRQQDIDFENDQKQDSQECEGNGED